MTYDKQLQAYTSATHMVRKTKQVVMLYEGAIRSMQQARLAIEEKKIEDRYNSLSKAADILHGLQLSLDMDNGGEISQLLHDYYSGLDMRISTIHRSEDLDMCDACIRHLKMMKEAWEEIDESSDESESINESSAVYKSATVETSTPTPSIEDLSNICMNV